MIGFLLRRLTSAAVLLFVLAVVIFFLQVLAPGDPVKASLGANASAEALAQKRQELGLNDPLPQRFVHYLVQTVQGDLGTSFRTRRPVVDDLAAFLPATLELVLTAALFALALAAVSAFASTQRWPGNRALSGLLLVLANAPPFLLALGGVILFYSQWGWFPASGRGPDLGGPTGFLLIDGLIQGRFEQWASALHHLVLPSLVLAIAPALSIGRIFQSSLRTTLQADFIRTAQAKGLKPGRILSRHVIRNSLGPALSMTGLQLGFLFAAVVVVEQIFRWPGLGSYLAASLPVSDFPAIAGITLVLGAIFILVNLIVDILQVVADPRMSL